MTTQREPDTSAEGRERLTATRLRALLHYDPVTGAWTWVVARPGIRAGTKAGGSDGTKGYVKITVDGESYPAHRLAFLYMTGNWPAALVDHANGIPGDNRWANLREASHSENSRNRRRDRDSTSGFKGAYFDKSIGYWKGMIRVGGKLLYLGVFKTPEEAHQAYCRAAKEHFGNFARVA